MRRLSLLITLAFLCTLTLAAQNVRIEGTVLDADTGVPISGAKAALRYATSPAPLESAETEATGTFQLSITQPGRYAVELSAPGFEETLYSGTGGAIEFDAAQDVHELPLCIVKKSIEERKMEDRRRYVGFADK